MVLQPRHFVIMILPSFMFIDAADTCVGGLQKIDIWLSTLFTQRCAISWRWHFIVMDLNPWRCSPDTSPSLLYHRFRSLMPRIPVLVVYKNIDISLSTQYCAISIFCLTFKREVMRGCERDLHQKQCKTGHRQPNSLTSMFECWKTNNHQSDFWGGLWEGE